MTDMTGKTRGVRNHTATRGRTDAILRTLRKRIAEHDLPPGTRLQELDLATQFRVSRSVIREILGALEQRGLVNRIPNRGAVVARLDPKEIFEIFAVREALEALCVELATRNAPADTWEPHRQLFAGPLADAIEQGDIARYTDALEALRSDILRWADNDHAHHFLDLVLDKAQLIARRVTLLPGRAAMGRSLHLTMLEQMQAGDGAAAADTRRHIIRSARQWLERYREFIL